MFSNFASDFSYYTKKDAHSMSDDDGQSSKGGISVASCRTSPQQAEEARDEVKEIQKMSQMETQLIRTWRAILLVMLVGTASAVSSITFLLLQKNENTAYKATFEKFAQTIGDATIEHDKKINEALRSLSASITAYSESVNANWPFFHVPYFASYAMNSMKMSGAEMVWLFNTVPHNLREEYIQWSNDQYYNRVAEANMFVYGDLTRMPDNSSYVADITWKTEDGFVSEPERDLYYATSEVVPPVFSYVVWNWDLNSVPFYTDILKTAVRLRTEGLWTNVRQYTTVGLSFTPEQHAAMHSNRKGSQPEQPHSFRYIPVFRSLQDNTSDAVAIINFPVAWDVPLRHALPEAVENVNVVLRNTCNQTFTYLVHGPDAYYIGEGALHDRTFDVDRISFDLWESTDPDFLTDPYHCRFSVDVYPTRAFRDSHVSRTPKVFAAVIAGTFLLMIAAFVVYDLIVQRRNRVLVHNAARSNAIVTSLFPKNIRDRIVAQEENEGDNRKKGKKAGPKGPPIADLYLESTILFADVVGFTAWSSVREPSQVFSLLETLFGAFDKVAETRRVFKVETVGDCYVAAAGIPDYRKDHAIAMVRFAGDIMSKMSKLVKRLEITLGPDTGDLSLRIGIHSGPITAGVLRGQRSRFQLFGDTMNTTARMESTSRTGRIQLSSETAKLLIQNGKGHWIEKRHDEISVKGKGSLQTYWLNCIKGRYCGGEDSGSHGDGATVDDGESDERSETLQASGGGGVNNKTSRLIEWNTETLVSLLKQIAARRSVSPSIHSKNGDTERQSRLLIMEKTQQSSHPLDEVQEIIHLPEYNAEAVCSQTTIESYEIEQAVVDQVREYVTLIASMYRPNAFHNFEHASHVTMSVTKLLSRIVAPKDLATAGGTGGSGGGDDGGDNDDKKDVVGVSHEFLLHDHTYGITSDPLTQFSCAFSALIHDVDHTGVPNAQLVVENHPLASLFRNRSVAEQYYSLTLAWDLLMEDRFHDFRRCLYTTEAEWQRFRHLVVNGVMATDIADRDLKNLRNARWAKAFDQNDTTTTTTTSTTVPPTSKADVDRKATIVIEHLIQASDIAHTLQHWHVYRKWNERLFTEMYQAYLDGHSSSSSGKDPSTFWYEGELGFFDFYIIPLAKKLKECGVFGVSSDEYLNYALNNREEWEHRGRDVVAEMMEQILPTLVASPTAQTGVY